MLEDRSRAPVLLAEEQHGQRLGETDAQGEEREGQDRDPGGRLPVEVVQGDAVAARVMPGGARA